MDSSSSAIKIENVWKVFGNTSKIVLDAIQNDKISKTEALEKYNSVIGVSDVSFISLSAHETKNIIKTNFCVLFIIFNKLFGFK